jgi:hypothetical protein
LTQAEKHDELLLKNHHKRPVGSAPLPEVHNVQKNTKNKNKFYGPDPKNKFVNANTTGDKGLIQTRGKRTMQNPKMTISVIDVEIFHILPRISVHLSIWLSCTKSPKKMPNQQETQDMRHTSILHLRLSRKRVILVRPQRNK